MHFFSHERLPIDLPDDLTTMSVDILNTELVRIRDVWTYCIDCGMDTRPEGRRAGHELNRLRAELRRREATLEPGTS